MPALSSPSQRYDAKLITAMALVLFPIALVYGVLFHEMRDVPLLDDYHAVLQFILTMKHLPSLGSKLLWIVAAQHSEYKLIFEHAILAAQWAITGDVRFEFLIVLGDLMMLGMLWVLWANYFAEERDLTKRFFLFAPVCYLILQLNYVDTLNWAMCGLQTIPVNMFALAAVHFLIRPRQRDFAMACLCVVLACFSSANGFLMAPVGLLFLLLARRGWRQIGVWSITCAGAFALYLYRYTATIVDTHGAHASLAAKMLYFVMLVGGAAENQHRFPIRNGSLILGFGILAVFAVACRKRFHREHAFAFYTTIWVLLTAAVITAGRSDGGLDTSLTGRYKIYSDLLLIFCYFCGVLWFGKSGLQKARKQQIYLGALTCVMLFSFACDLLGYQLLAKRNLRVAVGMNEFEADPARNSPSICRGKNPMEDWLLSGQDRY
jgi:hypothetical protein